MIFANRKHIPRNGVDIQTIIGGDGRKYVGSPLPECEETPCFSVKSGTVPLFICKVFRISLILSPPGTSPLSRSHILKPYHLDSRELSKILTYAREAGTNLFCSMRRIRIICTLEVGHLCKVVAHLDFMYSLEIVDSLSSRHSYAFALEGEGSLPRGVCSIFAL